MNIRKTALLTGLSVCFAAGCGPSAPSTVSSKPILGKVFQQGTNAPIEGALVVLKWSATAIPKGFTGANPPTLCYHVESAVTDSEGRYHTAAWREPQKYNLPNGSYEVSVYKKGLEMVATAGSNVSMIPSADSKQDRMKAIRGTAVLCSNAGGSGKSAYALNRAIYDEVVELDSTHTAIDNLRYHVAWAALAGTDDSDPNTYEDRVQAYIEENLK